MPNEDYWVTKEFDKINKEEPDNILLKEYCEGIPDFLKLAILDSFDKDDYPED